MEGYTQFSLGGDGKNSISFWTDNDELYKAVYDYINNVVDAIRWRNQLVQTIPPKKRL